MAHCTPTEARPYPYNKDINQRDTPMTNYALTPALTDAVMALYGCGFYGHDDVAGFWNYCADGFTGSLDDLVALVADDMACND